MPQPNLASRSCGAGVLRLGYFGRLDPDYRASTSSSTPCVHGRRMPRCSWRSTAYANPAARPIRRQPSNTPARQKDPRVVFLPALPPSEAVGETMRRCDLVVVPSRWLETGPLVVLEAFAAGTPVLGTRLGGIAELVNDQIDGLLMSPQDPGAWASAIAALAAAPERVARLRTGIIPPRTMDDVARDMAGLYQTLLGDAGS